MQLDGADGAVALLADDDLGDVAHMVHVFLPGQVFGRALARLGPAFVIALAIDEHDHVGVLFDRSGFAQVRQLGPLVLARLHLARQLRQGDDRHRELFGQGLEAHGDLADFLHPVVLQAAVAQGDQLQIVDHQQVEPALALQPPRPRRQLGQGQAAGGVDMQGAGLQLKGRVAHPAEFRGVDLALAQPV